MVPDSALQGASCPLCRDLMERIRDHLRRIGELLDAEQEALDIRAENLWTALNRELERELEAQGSALKGLADHKDAHIR